MSVPGPVTLSGRWTLDDRLRAPVHALPVELPPGTAAFTVELSYDRSSGVLDLGCEGPAGFRGWSGGARSRYTIAPGWATPGYLPGELEQGVWRVLTGLYRVPFAGLPYQVTVTPHADPPPPPVPPAAPPPSGVVPASARRRLPELDGLRWRAGDLHAHTVHSDGSLTVAELAALARSSGLDFLAVTDHNTVSHHAELPGVASAAGITLVPGQEVTTDLGHANAFGDIGWVDFREPADSWARAARERGGLLSVNHPLAADCAWRHPFTERPRTAEIWHSGWWDRTWGAPLAWAQAWRDDLVLVGGGDFHRPGENHPPGMPTTWVLAGGEGPGPVVAGVRAGRTAVSAGPDAPLLLRHGGEFLVLDADGLVLWGPEHRSVVRGDRVTLPALPGPHRLETPRNEVMALCT
ncbi:CehA/McbA family metallohydrolase [Sphaerisporangium corydalis]|uniref:CehA/McbA family metallohydrolase n=1 Tax=Sphaerisporangium corydalis TaxID=1441875 RepID=A0ABV9EFX0_9ACTN|nr:CehA/McbA family metallohydrolase [Sphaerisporangium corydalis]